MRLSEGEGQALTTDRHQEAPWSLAVRCRFHRYHSPLNHAAAAAPSLRYKSLRGHVWTDVDKARSGGLPFVFEDNMSFERWEQRRLTVLW